MDRIEPRIHDEIKDYKEKFYNFTIRQWLFAILIVIIVVPLYLFLSPIIGSDLTGWIVILVAGPIGFIGFIPIQGLSAEKMIFFWKRNYINFAKPILYKTETSNIVSISKEKAVKKEKTKISKEDKKKQKELKKERQRQRDLARAKKKFGEETRKQVNNKDFSLSEEEAKVLLKFARQVIGKETTIDEESEESIKEKESQEKTDNS
jgi:hypothetical protein